MRLLIKNIGTLVGIDDTRLCRRGAEMAEISCLSDAWLLVEDGRFKAFGGKSSRREESFSRFEVRDTRCEDRFEVGKNEQEKLPFSRFEVRGSRYEDRFEVGKNEPEKLPFSRFEVRDTRYEDRFEVGKNEPEKLPSHLVSRTSYLESLSAADQVIDAQGGMVLPSFCDSHTHLVYAGSREGEFVDKIRGLSYAEIARRGGGILNSSDRLHAASEETLYEEAMVRIREIIRKGTGAVEIKSGYGLNTADELKMLRVIRRIRETAPLRVVSTFLGAHAVGRAFTGRQKEYVDLVVNEMIPEVGRQQLADYVDVFCDEGFFTPDETARILEAAAKYGLRGKIHGQELADSGGVDVAVAHGACSVDHLESMTDRDIELLQGSDTIPTALPGTSFFLNMPFAPGRKMIDAGLPLAIASDYNPGSTPSGDMKFVVSLACIKMRLLPAEALNAATLNAACAMGISRDYGSITAGKVANFFITPPLPSLDFIPYAYTTPLVSRVFLRGKEYESLPSGKIPYITE